VPAGRDLLRQVEAPKTPAPANARTICLMDTIGKVFERVIATRLNAALDDAGGLSSN